MNSRIPHGESVTTRLYSKRISQFIYVTSFICMFLVSIPNIMYSATITWTGAVNNNWDVAGNWSTNAIPTSSDEVIISGTASVVVNSATNAFAGSLQVIGSSVEIMGNGELGIQSLSVASTGFSALFDNSQLTNHGQFTITGGLMMSNGSTLINNGYIIDFASVNNAMINFSLDNSTATNNSEGWIYSRDNIDPLGNNKFCLLQLNNNASFHNNGVLYNQYSSGSGDYLEHGIIVKNGSNFFNNDGFINLNWIRQIGVYLYNDLSITTPVTFENRTFLRIRETNVNTLNTSIAIKGETYSTFSNFPTGFIGMYLEASPTLPGFDNTTPQIDITGGISYSAVSTAFNPGNLQLGIGSSLAGSGPIDNTNMDFQGGSVLPGASPGIISFTAPFSVAAPTSFDMELAGTGGAGVSNGHDQIVFQATPNDLTDVSINVVLIDDYYPSVGDQFILFDGTYTGSFTDVSVPGGASSWNIQYNPTNITLELISPVLNIGNIGFGTDDPKTKVHVKDGDLYLETPGSGLIVRDANGDCRKITVDGSGVLQATLITCPQ